MIVGTKFQSQVIMETKGMLAITPREFKECSNTR
jgi:hypothetical protein